MQKLTSLLLSATLAVATTFSAVGAAPAKKVSASRSARITELSQVKKAPAKQSGPRVELPKHRKNAQNSFVNKAVKGTFKSKQALRLPDATDVSSLPELNGMVTFPAETPMGLYTIPTSASNDFTNLFLVEDPSSPYFAVEKDGVYYVHDFMDFFGFLQVFTVYGYDVETGELVLEQTADVTFLGPDAATDPTTGTVYAPLYNEDASGNNLCTINYSTSGVTTTVIAPLEVSLNVIACDKNGQLYGVGYDGNLYKIDKTTAAATLVGPTGITPGYLCSATIDPKTNRMLWAASPEDESGILVEVDLETGEASLVNHFANDEEVIGLYALVHIEAAAPAAATGLSAAFPEGALSGTFSFTAPATKYDGSIGTETLDYSVLANGVEVAKGQAAYAENVNVPVTVESAGAYTFIVNVSNAAGAGPKASYKTFIGNGIPAAPANVQAVVEDSDVTISWDAVSESVDGGYVNPEAVTYTVVRSDEKLIAENITALSCSDVIETGEGQAKISYLVTASFDGATSEAGKSNVLVFGSAELPWTADFAEMADLSDFVIIDENGDGKTWSLSAEGFAFAPYNANESMNDWLITPAVKLEAGKSYLVSFTASANGASFAERLEVKYGTLASAGGLTSTLLPATELVGTARQEFELFLTPETSGTYFVGFHGISDADSYYLKLYNISISDGISAAAPGGFASFTAEATAPYVLKAELKLTAPSKTLAGDALSSIDKIEVARDGELVKTFTAPAPGAELSFIDELPVDGDYFYTATAYNAEGAGKVAKASVYVGATIPADPTGVVITETTEGSIKLTWEPVTVDVDGNPIPEGKVTYVVADDEGYIIAEDLTECEYTAVVCGAGEQAFTQFGVGAVTAKGMSQGVYSDMIAVGTPFESYAESFADGKLHYPMASNSYGTTAQLGIATDETFSDVQSADGDNGFVYLRGQYIDDLGTLSTGKIKVPANAPAFTFNYYAIHPDTGNSVNTLTVSATQADGTETSLLDTTIGELSGGETGWLKAICKLDALSGKTVQLHITGGIQDMAVIAFDAFKVGELLEHDLELASITAPEKVKAGESYTVDVTITNEGAQKASGHSIELYADGELVESYPCDDLESGARFTTTFGLDMHALAEEPVELHAVVNHSADLKADNNTSQKVKVAPIVSNLPYVTDLSGSADENAIALAWSKPDVANYNEACLVDFEDGESFAHSYEGWTFVDGDDSVVGGFQGSDVPGITPGETKASFFVFDCSLEQFNQTFAANSGNKYLAAFFRYDDGQTDDWAISPTLDGSAQTISFFARSYSSQYPETIEMGYYDASEKFVVVETVDPVPAAWTKFSFDVPAGTKQFAIHSCASGSFMLMLDDFEFSAASSTAGELELKGYNVYRNGEKVNDTLVAEPAFSDTAEGTNVYAVTAVYEGKGESRGSNRVELSLSGLTDLGLGITVKAVGKAIVISGAEGQAVVVNALDGKTIFATGHASNTEKVATGSGIYLVKAGNTVSKVIVK